jgi:hypothetical protein
MLPLSYDNIKEFLKKEGHTPEFQEESQQMTVTVTIDEREFPTFFRIAEEGPTLQIVTFLPVAYKESTTADTARLLHLINKEVDLPGFGMDETSQTTFYRTVIPCFSKTFDPQLIQATFGALKVLSESFLNAVNAVAQGIITFDEAVNKAKEASQ